MMKRILIIVSILLVAGLAGYFYVMNKPHRTVDQETKINMAPQTLANEFEANEAEATKKYLNKPISITGIASEVTTNQDGQTVAFFSEDGITGVQATLRDKDTKITAGSKISVAGFCNGYSSVVLLSDCILNNN
jgi:uncharacterized membrane protein